MVRRKTSQTRFALIQGGKGRFRMTLLFAGLIVAGGVIAGRLYALQVLAHAQYASEAQEQHWLSQELMPERGEIYLQDNPEPYPLAVNREYSMAYAVPRVIETPAETALHLHELLGVDVEETLAKVSRRDDPFEFIKRKLSDEETARVEAAHLSGVYLKPERHRYYPSGETAAQVVGFVGMDGHETIGRYGVEEYWEETLRGESGNIAQEKDAGGRWIPLAGREFRPAKNGVDLVLTLNRVMQNEAEHILKASVEKFEAQSGTVIVMEPKTGKVLALASYPTFNPNEYGQGEVERFLNPATSLAYEPGSIMKPLVMAMGVDAGLVNPQTEYVDAGAVTEGGYTLRNAEDKVYGKSSMTRVLDESINTGAIYVEKLVGNTRFRDYLERFGFGAKTGIELPAELPGNLRNLEYPRRNLPFFTAAFGQGVTVTPLQMVTAYAALANQGVLMKPQIVEQIRLSDGTVETVQPTQVRRVVSQEAAETIGQMLRSVVVQGHGKRADVPGYKVAGKTGTAQVARDDTKGYAEHLTIGSFAGYAPLDDPRFAILVKIDNPQTVQWAESSAAPVFGEMMRFLLEYAKVQPTETTK